MNFRDIYTFQLIKTQSIIIFWHNSLPVLVTNEWLCEVIGSPSGNHVLTRNHKPFNIKQSVFHGLFLGISDGGFFLF